VIHSQLRRGPVLHPFPLSFLTAQFLASLLRPHSGGYMEEERKKVNVPVANGPVALTVVIGEGQLGASTVFRNGQAVVRGGVVIADLSLGDGAQLRGNSVVVESIVNDISTHTNRMSVKYVIRNNNQSQAPVVVPHIVATEGELCHFQTTLTFTA
jgi:hypothetical protein